MPIKNQIEIHGHRGARGLFPENTITAFIEAAKLGVDFLEMDLVISKDKKVVVSHEAWMNPDFCTKPDGKKIEKNAQQKYNLYKMNYSEIVGFDCGKKGNKEFPKQKSIPAYKPLLSEVITKVDAFTKSNHLPLINYNIEIKSELTDCYIFNPKPKIFVNLVLSEIKKLNIQSRIILQSFDVKILQEIQKKNPAIKISLLVENELSMEANLKKLGFVPTIYAPNFNLINKNLVKALNAKNIKLIAWTVNEIADVKRLINMGVNSIITDYPDRVINFIKK